MDNKDPPLLPSEIADIHEILAYIDHPSLEELYGS